MGFSSASPKGRPLGDEPSQRSKCGGIACFRACFLASDFLAMSRHGALAAGLPAKAARLPSGHHSLPAVFARKAQRSPTFDLAIPMRLSCRFQRVDASADFS
eukprot:TRINITY_DN31133_c0_g2_i1.p2 TRINITY_DN31133_c0_g2~~TRINITY_DN31133_c0_g2_i1.p2  ORF type:complete len:102 (-),score=12.48 TRINITY_DN31133_c0_g2_i1:40-345(-)